MTEEPSPNNRMTELIEYVAKTIADNPDDVHVAQDQDEDGTIILRLTVNVEDKGKVIGRQGRVAQAMRTLLRVTAVKSGSRAILEIV